MQTADLWISGNLAPAGLPSGMARRTRAGSAASAPSPRTSGDRTMHFDVLEERVGRWGWSLRDAYGQEVAHSPMPYPSRVQASAAALAFSQLVAYAGKQMRRP
ncbi:hypothetical protein MBUL_03350 [Methylobacterium bullatum]|uniref:DUF1508 domain-containing protein n=1 Tax=Methylobacterium bullatum TaxID=570505 RepID=A0A679J0H0_9HYPH|nr:hypothetical protein MBUL_03350 [Methylobacterium bullatum]